MSEFNPKCLHKKDLGYSVSGHITPCCWTNASWNVPQLEVLFTPELHIDNNETVEDILNSEIWTIFFDVLKNNPDQAPPRCKKFCTVPLNINIEEVVNLYD